MDRLNPLKLCCSSDLITFCEINFILILKPKNIFIFFFSIINELQEHIRQSKESKLDEVGRHSTKISRENLANIRINPR